MGAMSDDLYPDVPVPKTAWRWVEAAQYRLVRRGAHRPLSAIDLLIPATAAHHGLVVLHDDNDVVVVARVLDELAERNVHDTPDKGTDAGRR